MYDLKFLKWNGELAGFENRTKLFDIYGGFTALINVGQNRPHMIGGCMNGRKSKHRI